jgi:hypothetical protein
MMVGFPFGFLTPRFFSILIDLRGHIGDRPRLVCEVDFEHFWGWFFSNAKLRRS